MKLTPQLLIHQALYYAENVKIWLSEVIDHTKSTSISDAMA